MPDNGFILISKMGPVLYARANSASSFTDNHDADVCGKGVSATFNPLCLKRNSNEVKGMNCEVITTIILILHMHHFQLPHVIALATSSFVVMHHFHSVYNGRIWEKNM
jgi:hypothetical protein